MLAEPGAGAAAAAGLAGAASVVDVLEVLAVAGELDVLSLLEPPSLPEQPTDPASTIAATPTVVSNDHIAIKVAPEVSELDYNNAVTIGGTTFTVAQLGALSVSSPSAVIDTGEGKLRITGITVNTGPASAPKDASIGYTYTLKGQQDQPGATDSTDVIVLAVKDVNEDRKSVV